MNACAAIPGVFDRSVIGHPGKYTYCIAEAETETHWTPLHVERGFQADQSTVTVFAGESPRQVRSVGRPVPILTALADTASSLGTNMSTSGSVGETGTGVRQGEIVVTIAGNSGLWADWTKDHVRDFIFPARATKRCRVEAGPGPGRRCRGPAMSRRPYLSSRSRPTSSCYSLGARRPICPQLFPAGAPRWAAPP